MTKSPQLVFFVVVSRGTIDALVVVAVFLVAPVNPARLAGRRQDG